MLEKFDQENLQIVTVNVNGEDVDQESMAAYSKAKAGGSKRWWFANTDTEAFNAWSQRNLGFAEFVKNTGPEAAIMPIQHDLGIAVIGEDLVMRNKEDVFSASVPREGMTEEQTRAYGDLVHAQLTASVRKTLTGEEIEFKGRSKTDIYLAIAAGLLVAFISAFIIQSKIRPSGKKA